jgi:adenine-specific DNA-methyltransferase
MANAPHRGNSGRVRSLAIAAADLRERSDYVMTTLYFSGSYFSSRQAIALDALRFALDGVEPGPLHDWLMSCWLATAARLVNAPGHTAQFLKPNSDPVFGRIVRQWRRPVWPTFREMLATLRPVGSKGWRLRNRVISAEAGELVKDGRRLKSIGAAYADPPYTKDHYSRFYHLYETLYEYDFPDSQGAGRYRSGRSPSRFSLATEVVPAFSELLQNLALREIPLVLSYPSDGLIQQTGTNLRELIETEMSIRRHIRISTTHSTMGAHRGGSSKNKEENLYVCVPR